MTALTLRATGARAERHAAVPTLLFDVAIDEDTAASIESIMLRCQVRIEPHRRKYSAAEESRLGELFGDTPRWGDTLKPFLWTHASTLVPGFSGHTQFELPVACSYDFEVAASKYMHALENGEIPVLLLFSGTIFSRGETSLQATPVPWDREASYRLPVSVWRELMDLYFPNAGWLRLHRETLDGLLRCKARRALGSWDEVVQALLKDAGESAP